MSSGFSPHNEQFLTHMVADGFFSSREAALDAAIDALREKQGDIPLIPEEHMALVEEGLEDLELNGATEMTAADWERLRQLARDVAAGRDRADE